ncbi:MAG: TolC family protein [Gammaproteobacteria bacterium]|nr:TolC family protein [Gammaproteobacteria bacterium]
MSLRYLPYISFTIFIFSPLLNANTLTLHQAEAIALQQEPGLISQKFKSLSLIEKSISDSQLMDPKIQVAMSNLPTDSFDFNQEPMTQLKISYLQQFPSGNTLQLKKEKAEKSAELSKSKISERKLMILKNVRLSFLEIYYWEQAKKTILQNKQLFTQLVDIVQSLFAVGRNNQQDLIRAQLELSRLDDRLTKIEQKILTQRSTLSRWLGSINSQYALADKVPDLPTINLTDDTDTLNKTLLEHPKVSLIDKKIEIVRKNIEIVNESLNPSWGLNVSYGYRGNDASGKYRADFISAAATFDLPFFTEKRQDKSRLSKEYEYQSLKNKRLEVIRQLTAEVQQEIANMAILEKRKKLYQKHLLPQAKQQSQASLLAYQSDRGNFSDVMRAYMDDLNANLDAKRITIDSRKAQAKILYFSPNLR